MQKTVYANNKPFYKDYERQTRVLKEQIAQIDVNKERIANNTIYKCDNRGNTGPDDSGYFFPVVAGVLSPKSQEFTYNDGICFKKIIFSYS